MSVPKKYLRLAYSNKSGKAERNYTEGSGGEDGSVEEVEEAGVHLMAERTVGRELATDVGVDVTIVHDVLDLALSDSGIGLRADPQLRADFCIGAVREGSVITDERAEGTMKTGNGLRFGHRNECSRK